MIAGGKTVTKSQLLIILKKAQNSQNSISESDFKSFVNGVFQAEGH